jgi:hypothetical protein
LLFTANACCSKEPPRRTDLAVKTHAQTISELRATAEDEHVNYRDLLFRCTQRLEELRNAEWLKLAEHFPKDSVHEIPRRYGDKEQRFRVIVGEHRIDRAALVQQLFIEFQVNQTDDPSLRGRVEFPYAGLRYLVNRRADELQVGGVFSKQPLLAGLLTEPAVKAAAEAHPIVKYIEIDDAPIVFLGAEITFRGYQFCITLGDDPSTDRVEQIMYYRVETSRWPEVARPTDEVSGFMSLGGSRVAKRSNR